ncbi:MAG: hypothetical protein EBX50_21435 [Chitinophagia bacterium]|nr:hypothetical protein [Chitinophagia bacterium]
MYFHELTTLAKIQNGPIIRNFYIKMSTSPAGLLPYKVLFHFKIPINQLRSTTFYLPFLY